jgi:tetratricopeptide (TPR) repeat protein
VYEVVAPPFYSRASRTSEAKSIYDAGLREFAGGSELKAIEMFRQAIELDPLFADAYESLGVTLSRNERLDEAIALMKQLAVLDPQSIMAHANLSVYYMQQGNKELAEEEKAVAMSIRMSQMAREMASQQKEEEERQQLKAAAEERMNMFRQVLAIDPDDFLANAGLGSVYIDLGQYENALPCLLKAIEKKPTHTVAYLALGQAYEKLDRVGEAIDIYKRGIQVAAQRGDGEPMKKMQKRLDVLATTAGS